MRKEILQEQKRSKGKARDGSSTRLPRNQRMVKYHPSPTQSKHIYLIVNN